MSKIMIEPLVAHLWSKIYVAMGPIDSNSQTWLLHLIFTNALQSGFESLTCDLVKVTSFSIWTPIQKERKEEERKKSSVKLPII